MADVHSNRRIDYAGSVHDEREIEAVVEVLRGGPTALRIGKNVKAMEQRVAALFGKRRGVMCNSGSSALYLAIEVLELEPGDEIVTPWPSFPSYVLDPLKASSVTVRVPLDDGRVDVDALLAAVTPRTKLAFVPTVNNPTGAMTPRDDLLRFLDGVPEHVLTVVDEAYFQYVDDPSFPDAIEEAAKAGRNVLALRTFSKIFGLAGLRIGYGIGPAHVISAMRKVQRAFDVTTPAQEAALASLDDDAEVERRRAVNREAMAALEAVLREHGFDPITPAVGNFLFVDVGEDADAHALQARVDLGVVDDLAGKEDAAVGELLARPVRVLHRAVHAVAEAELAGQAHHHVPRARRVAERLDALHHRAAVALGQHGPHGRLEPEALLEVGAAHALAG